MRDGRHNIVRQLWSFDWGYHHRRNNHQHALKFQRNRSSNKINLHVYSLNCFQFVRKEIRFKTCRSPVSKAAAIIWQRDVINIWQWGEISLSLPLHLFCFILNVIKKNEISVWLSKYLGRARYDHATTATVIYQGGPTHWQSAKGPDIWAPLYYYRILGIVRSWLDLYSTFIWMGYRVSCGIQ